MFRAARPGGQSSDAPPGRDEHARGEGATRTWRRAEQERAVRLFIGNLPYNVTSEDLERTFSEAGTVTSARVITDRETGQSRGFGFVEMGSAADGQKAISMWNGQDLN